MLLFFFFNGCLFLHRYFHSVNHCLPEAMSPVLTNRTLILCLVDTVTWPWAKQACPESCVMNHDWSQLVWSAHSASALIGLELCMWANPGQWGIIRSGSVLFPNKMTGHFFWVRICCLEVQPLSCNNEVTVLKTCWGWWKTRRKLCLWQHCWMAEWTSGTPPSRFLWEKQASNYLIHCYSRILLLAAKSIPNW